MFGQIRELALGLAIVTTALVLTILGVVQVRQEMLAGGSIDDLDGLGSAVECSTMAAVVTGSAGFEINQGQVHESIKFVSRGAGYTLYLAPTESVLALRRPRAEVDGKWGSTQSGSDLSRDRGDTTVVRMSLLEANPKTQLQGLEQMPVRTSYIVGDDPLKWHSSVPTFARVRYHNIYPGIDLVYHRPADRLQFDLILAPDVDPTLIRLGFEGVEGLEKNDSGDLVLHTNAGLLELQKPIAYQETDDARREVVAAYVLQSQNSVAFEVGPYDSSLPLVIDPVVTYLTYLGGSGYENGRFLADIAVDSQGQAYVTGSTTSLDFPSVDPYQPSIGGTLDAYVAKINSDGSGLVYCTYFGGNSIERGMGIAVDGLGNAYLTGRTQSMDFPTVGAIQEAMGGVEDAFITKLGPDGSTLLYSTYLGGTNTDYGLGIAVDPGGSAYVLGATWSLDLPTVNAFQPSSGGGVDSFVAKLDPAGNVLDFLTYLGGSQIEVACDNCGKIAVDTDGSVCVAGSTTSADFPTKNPFQSAMKGNVDAFLTKLTPSGSSLVYSTYFGGTQNDGAVSLALDEAGSPYLVGNTDSTDIPTVNSVQSTFAADIDVFVSRFSPDGSTLQFSTYLGGDGEDIGYDIAIDSVGSLRITGTTTSLDFPTLNGFQDYMKGNRDAFIVKLTPSGAYEYSTFMGGTDLDYGLGIAVGEAGDTYVVGQTWSTEIATQGAFQMSLAGEGDAFITKVNDAIVDREIPYYLPQAANGTWQGGSYRTTLVMINPNDEAAAVSIRLTDDTGDPMTVRFPSLGTNHHFDLVLETGATQFIQTDGTGSLQVGAVSVISDRRIGVEAIFTLYDDVGGFLTEAGVGSSIPIQRFKLPVELNQSVNTGIALLNAEKESADVSLTLIDETGGEVDNRTLALEGGHHLARFVGGTGEFFPALEEFKGTLDVYASIPVAAVALRQTRSPQNYTSLPVLDERSHRKEFRLPQIADGFFGKGSFTTSFLLLNNRYHSPAAVTLLLLRDDGSDLAVSIGDDEPSSRWEVVVPGNGSSFIRTSAKQALTTGAATILSDVSLGAAAIFSLYDLEGRPLTEAGVGDSEILTDFTLPADVGDGVDTGVALFNPGTASARIEMTLLDSGGNKVATTSQELGSRCHSAKFVSELFPGTTDLRGSLSVRSSSGIVSLTLRQNSNPLCFTTLPVVEGTIEAPHP